VHLNLQNHMKRILLIITPCLYIFYCCKLKN